MERHIGCILLAQRDVLAKHSWVRSSRRVYPGSRNALLSSYAWRAKLAGRTLCKEKREIVSTHMGRNTPVLHKITRESKSYYASEMVFKQVIAWLV